MELKYYYIEKAENLSPKIYEQTGITDEYIFVNKGDNWGLFSEEELDVIVHKLKFNGKAKITEAIYADYRIYVNERIRNILEEYNIVMHQYVKATFKTMTSELLPYYYMHIPLPGVTDYVDYKNSTFNGVTLFKTLEDIKVNSKKELEIAEKEGRKKDILYLIQIRDIAFTKEFNPETDILTLLYLPSKYQYLVSERLKNRLEEENITGIIFKEYPYKISISE